MNTLTTVLLVIYVGTSLLLLIYGLNAYLMVGLYLRQRRRRRQAPPAEPPYCSEGELPMVTTQLPIYNERNVIERLLRAVCAMDYPRDRHQIQILDDSTDETTALIADLTRQLRADGHDVQHRRRDERSGYKAGALAEGLAEARGEFIAIFDADFLPERDFLRRTIPTIAADPNCAFVQTRWGHCNRDFSLLTYLQSIGIDGHFVVEQATRSRNDLFFNFNGTAGVWRKAAIAAAGGWQADTLTEDLDLSYRALLAGWRARFLDQVVAPAEIPTDINALKAQQRRWAKGSIQTAMKLLPTVLTDPRTRLFKKIQACLHMTHYMIHPLILVLTILVLPLIFLLGLNFTSPFTAPVVSVMLLALCGPSTLYLVAQVAKGGDWRRALLWMPALIALGIGLAVNNTRAVIEGLLGKRSEFVRTPKLGAAAEGTTPLTGSKRYQPPRSRLYLVEIFMGLWALAAFVGYLIEIGSLAGCLLLVQAIGFTAVGLISLTHHRHAARSGC